MADFFDRLKEGVEKGVTTFSVKSKEMVELARLKTQIADVQKQKKDALEELGNIVYTMYLKSDFDEERLRANSAAINALDEEIKRKEAELAEIRAKAQEALCKPQPVVTCGCGADIREGAKFCGKCVARTS